MKKRILKFKIKGRKNLIYLIFMKNINISPSISLITGIILIIIVRVLLNTQAVIPQAIQFLGFILVILGLAGLIGKLFRKKTINQ